METLRNKDDHRKAKLYGGCSGGDGGDEFDVEVWNALNDGIEKVQALLEQNRALIHQVDDNHLSMIPENLVKNVGLICEINDNITRILGIYSDISVEFTNLVRQRKFK